MASVHETAEGLHNAGLLDKQTMRQFDTACTTPVRPLTPIGYLQKQADVELHVAAGQQ